MSNGICLITGGSRGIGASCARLAAQRGWHVVINYNSNLAAAEQVAADVVAAGAKAKTVQGNIATQAGVEATYAAVDAFAVELAEPLSAVINNAGASDPVGDLSTFSYDRVERVVALNVTGAIWVAREAVMRMATRFGGQGGSIVNLSSASAKLGSPDAFIDYAATKGAIDTFTIGLALEWARDGIRCNAVRPGIIDTEFQANVGRPDRPKTDGPKTPMGRAGTPDEVAEAILWLMSDAASYTTGGFIDISGGRSAIP